jgi:hypothetical protein
MHTTVITAEAVDYGVGATSAVTFADTTWHIDDGGHLHILRPNRGGNSAAFAPGEWCVVLEGGVIAAMAEASA